MSAWHSARDTCVLPIYEFTCGLARLDAIPGDLVRILEAAQGNQEAMDGFARLYGGATSPAEFFSESNISRLRAGAESRSRR